MSKTINVAVPSMGKGGLDAERSSHFGRCDCFSILSFDEKKKFIECRIVENPPHVEGGCLAPVNLLAARKVNAIVVGGIGGRPLAGFQSVGIEVLVSEGDYVKDVKENFEKGKVSPISADFVCGGHH